MSFLLSLGGLQSKCLNAFDFDLNSTPLDSPLYPQPRTILIHSSPVQNFQNFLAASLDQICHFGETHYFSSPKILRKIMRPPDASRDLSTKDQLQKNFPHARIISSNRWHALFLCRFSVQCSVQSPVSFSSEPRRPSRQYPRWPLAPCSSFLSTAPHGRLDGRERRR